MNHPTPESPKLIELAGPSGTGKTTLAKKLLEDIDTLKFSVSATTRPPRPYEEHGRNYYFMSDREFDKHIEEQKFLEWEKVYSGSRYGTLKSEVDKQYKSGYFTLLDVDVEGALNVKNIYGQNCLAIFIKPPSMEELKKRLVNRKTESTQSLEDRLKKAEKEITYAGRFDHIIINKNVDIAYQEVHKLVKQFIENS